MTIVKKKRPIDYIIYTAVIIVGIIIDQLTKFLTVKYMTIGQTIPLIKDFLHITYITNDGGAFGQMDGPVERAILLTVSTVAIIGFAIYLYLGHADGMLYGVAFAMVVSGGFSNMIDRLGFGFYVNPETGIGEVVDFIDFRGIWNAVFNGADSFVCIGAGLLILALILDLIKESKAKKAVEAAAEEPATEEEPTDKGDEK